MPTDLLAGHAQNTPDHVAIIDGDTSITYGDLNRTVNRLANGLLALGLRPGDRAVWCGANSVPVITFLHAARKIGLRICATKEELAAYPQPRQLPECEAEGAKAAVSKT